MQSEYAELESAERLWHEIRSLYSHDRQYPDIV
jgi:hypothetical protein